MFSSRKLAAPTALLTTIGFVLFLLVTISIPISKQFYLVSLTDALDSSSDAFLRIGVWGVCEAIPIGAYIHASFVLRSAAMGFTPHVGNQSDKAELYSALSFGSSGIANDANPNPNYSCRPPEVGMRVGYSPSFDTSTTRLAPASLSKALAVNTVMTGVAGVAMLWNMFNWTVSAKWSSVTNAGFAVAAALVSWIAFGIDLGYSVRARDTLSGLYQTLQQRQGGDIAANATLGNANWLALGGALALTFAALLAVYEVASVAKSQRRTVDSTKLTRVGSDRTQVEEGTSISQPLNKSPQAVGQ